MTSLLLVLFTDQLKICTRDVDGDDDGVEENRYCEVASVVFQIGLFLIKEFIYEPMLGGKASWD